MYGDQLSFYCCFSDAHSCNSGYHFASLQRPQVNRLKMIYLTIIPRAYVGYEMIDTNEARSAELAIIISYPTSASGIIVLLKTPQD